MQRSSIQDLGCPGRESDTFQQGSDIIRKNVHAGHVEGRFEDWRLGDKFGGCGNAPGERL